MAALVETWADRFGFLDDGSESSHDLEPSRGDLEKSSHVVEQAAAVLPILRDDGSTYGPAIVGRKNWLFTWLDDGGERTANILSIVATCIAHDVNPRAYLHVVTKLIVDGWPNARLRELLPDRILAPHPKLYVGDGDTRALPASGQ